MSPHLIFEAIRNLQAVLREYGIIAENVAHYAIRQEGEKKVRFFLSGSKIKQNATVVKGKQLIDRFNSLDSAHRKFTEEGGAIFTVDEINKIATALDPNTPTIVVKTSPVTPRSTHAAARTTFTAQANSRSSTEQVISSVRVNPNKEHHTTQRPKTLSASAPLSTTSPGRQVTTSVSVTASATAPIMGKAISSVPDLSSRSPAVAEVRSRRTTPQSSADSSLTSIGSMSSTKSEPRSRSNTGADRQEVGSKKGSSDISFASIASTHTATSTMSSVSSSFPSVSMSPSSSGSTASVRETGRRTFSTPSQVDHNQAKKIFLEDLKTCVLHKSWEKLGRAGLFSTKVPTHVNDMRLCLQSFNGNNVKETYQKITAIIEKSRSSSFFRDDRTAEFYEILQNVVALQKGLEQANPKVAQDYDLVERFRSELRGHKMTESLSHAQDISDESSPPINFKMPTPK